jgi:peroxiredoxin
MNTRRWTLGIAVIAIGLLTLQVARAAGDTKALKGKPAPDFTLKTLDGKEVTLSDQKGSVVLMDFWATWCGPCKASLPHVQKLSADKELAAKGLKVWAVNAHEEKNKVSAFTKENSYSFEIPLDAKGATMKEYMVQGIPTTVIVGRDGTIKNVFIGFGGEESAKQIDDAVNEALAEAAPGKTS